MWKKSTLLVSLAPKCPLEKKKSLTAAEWFVLSFNYVIITLN